MPAGDERKPVTVLFAEVASSTELATRHDPEHLRALLAAFFDEMRQQVEAYGGTVEKYAGDAVVAVFGVPQVHEDDAERAVRAAGPPSPCGTGSPSSTPCARCSPS
jgi:class 3 adenylate cyclase